MYREGSKSEWTSFIILKEYLNEKESHLNEGFLSVIINTLYSGIIYYNKNIKKNKEEFKIEFEHIFNSFEHHENNSEHLQFVTNDVLNLFSDSRFVLEMRHITFMCTIIGNYNSLYEHLGSLYASLKPIRYFLKDIIFSGPNNTLEEFDVETLLISDKYVKSIDFLLNAIPKITLNVSPSDIEKEPNYEMIVICLNKDFEFAKKNNLPELDLFLENAKSLILDNLD